MTTFEDLLHEASDRLLAQDESALCERGAGAKVAAADGDVQLAHVWPLVPASSRSDLTNAIRAGAISVRFAAIELLARVDGEAGREMIARWLDLDVDDDAFAPKSEADPYRRYLDLARDSMRRAAKVCVYEQPLDALIARFARLSPDGDTLERIVDRVDDGGVEALGKVIFRTERLSLAIAKRLAARALAEPPRAGAIALLGEALRTSTHRGARQEIATLLQAKGSSEALDALAAAIDWSRPFSREFREIALLERTMITAAMRRMLDRSFAELRERFLEPSALVDPDRVSLAALALRLGKSSCPSLPALHHACVALLDAPAEVASPAKSILAALDKKALDPLLASRVRPKPTKEKDATKDRVARYRAGDHAAVWRELDALGSLESAPSLKREVEAVAELTIERFLANVDRIYAILRQGRYRAAAKKPWTSAKKPPAMELPVLLRVLYQNVDSISLAENPRAVYAGDTPFEMHGRNDPLVILPLSKTIADYKKHVAAEKKLPAALRDAPRLRISPSPAAKYDPDGEVADDDPLVAILMGDTADVEVGALQSPGPRRSLIDYLRAVIAAGGFLAPADDHRRALLRAGETPF